MFVKSAKKSAQRVKPSSVAGLINRPSREVIVDHSDAILQVREIAQHDLAEWGEGLAQALRNLLN